MPANFMKGDLLGEAAAPSGPRVLAFGADCSGSMEHGVASAIRQRWPAFAEAFAAHAKETKMQLGQVFAWRDGDLAIYALGITKDGARPKIGSLERALASAAVTATEAAERPSRVLLPRLGGGKSGLDWTRVKRVIQEVAATTHVDFVVFEQFVRTGAGSAGEPPASEGAEEG